MVLIPKHTHRAESGMSNPTMRKTTAKYAVADALACMQTKQLTQSRWYSLCVFNSDSIYATKVSAQQHLYAMSTIFRIVYTSKVYIGCTIAQNEINSLHVRVRVPVHAIKCLGFPRLYSLTCAFPWNAFPHHCFDLRPFREAHKVCSSIYKNI